MKALNVIQPWALLLAAGAKRYETRSWATNHRGPLLIVASNKWTAPLNALCHGEPYRSALEAAGVDFSGDWGQRPPAGLDVGKIIGLVTLTDCLTVQSIRLTDAAAPEITFGDWSPGRFAWRCETPVRFAEPIPWKGHLGVYDVPDALIPESCRSEVRP